jgi:hypothetical protein
MAPALALAIAVIWSVSCRSGSTEEAAPAADQQPMPAPKPTPKHETGNCRNEHLEGTCTFIVTSRVPSQPGDAQSETTLYRVEHQIEVKEDGRKIDLTSAYVSIPDRDRDRLDEHYRKNSPTPCKAYLVRPPCNPNATWVDLGFDPPPFAKKERF